MADPPEIPRCEWCPSGRGRFGESDEASRQSLENPCPSFSVAGGSVDGVLDGRTTQRRRSAAVWWKETTNSGACSRPAGGRSRATSVATRTLLPVVPNRCSEGPRNRISSSWPLASQQGLVRATLYRHRARSDYHSGRTPRERRRNPRHLETDESTAGIHRDEFGETTSVQCSGARGSARHPTEFCPGPMRRSQPITTSSMHSRLIHRRSVQSH